MVTLGAEDTGLIVRPEVARRQLEVEAPPPSEPGPTDVPPGPEGEPKPPPAAPTGLPRRFHGTARLDPARVGRDASRIADEVIAHLVGLVGAEVDVTLEIEARLPNGATDQTVRIVNENSRTLKFTSHEFESE